MRRWLPVIAVLIGCGGGGPEIRHRVAMDKIWHTPSGERAAVAKAYKQLAAARTQLAHSRFLLDDTQREVSIARSERDRARLGVRIVDLQQKRHAASYRQPAAAEAARELVLLQKQESTLDRKIAYLERREEFLRREISRLELEAHAAEARFELAKAKIAVSRGTLAQKKLQPFEVQARRAEQRTAAARQASQNARDKSEAARKAWGGS